MHISVIGTGYVGLVTGACIAEFGVNVTCMDTDARRIARLEKGEVPFFEPGITELVAKGIKEDRLAVPAFLLSFHWYAKNWWVYGNPIEPFQLSVLGHEVFKGSVDS